MENTVGNQDLQLENSSHVRWNLEDPLRSVIRESEGHVEHQLHSAKLR